MTKILLSCLLMVLLMAAHPAQACSMRQPPPFEQLQENAKTIFVGTVRTVENGLVIFHVEKGLKGIADDASFEFDEIASTCNISFQAGQRWLYLGGGAASGSLMLMSELGYVMADNVAFVKEHFGDAALAAPDDVVGGTVEDSCAPWDGAAFDIKLQNGTSASVYASLRDNNGVVYPADGKSESGHAFIAACPAAKKDSAENLPCQSANGTVTIGNVNADSVNGQIETATPDGEYHSRIVFKVKRLNTRAICG